MRSVNIVIGYVLHIETKIIKNYIEIFERLYMIQLINKQKF